MADPILELARRIKNGEDIRATDTEDAGAILEVLVPALRDAGIVAGRSTQGESGPDAKAWAMYRDDLLYEIAELTDKALTQARAIAEGKA